MKIKEVNSESVVEYVAPQKRECWRMWIEEDRMEDKPKAWPNCQIQIFQPILFVYEQKHKRVILFLFLA